MDLNEQALRREVLARLRRLQAEGYVRRYWSAKDAAARRVQPKGSSKGFPDLVVVLAELEDVAWNERGGRRSAVGSRIVALELKTKDGAQRPDQKAWAEAFGFRYALCRSLDEVLRALDLPPHSS